MVILASIISTVFAILTCLFMIILITKVGWYIVLYLSASAVLFLIFVVAIRINTCLEDKRKQK